MPDGSRAKLNKYLENCVPEKHKRSSDIEDVYTARLLISGETVDNAELHHITLPLPEEKEAVIAVKLGLEKEDMAEFYDWLWRRVSSNIAFLRTLNKNRVAGICELYSADMISEENLRHIFFVTAAYQPYRETIAGKTVPLITLVGHSIRVGNIVRDISALDIVHGNICLDSLYTDAAGNLYLGNFFFGLKKGEPAKDLYRYALPPHIPEQALSAHYAGATGADTYAAASLLWNLVNGYPADERLPYRYTEGILSEKLQKLLAAGLQSDTDSLPVYRRLLSEMRRGLPKGEDVNINIRVNAYRPSYNASAYAAKTPTQEDLIGDIISYQRTASEAAREGG